MDDKKKLKKEIWEINANIAAGLVTGVVSGGIFHPIDRASFLSHKHHRPFLSIENFKTPYHGFSQTLVHRSIFGGLYFIIQSEMRTHLYPVMRKLGCNESTAQLGVGLSAGGLYGITMHAPSAIKYHTWGQENISFFSSAHHMWTQGGMRPFVRGISSGASRDIVFGSTYEGCRSILRNQFIARSEANSPGNDYSKNALAFACDLAAAGIGTAFASPFNYLRNMAFAAPVDNTPSPIKIFTELGKNAQSRNNLFFGRTRYIAFERFQIGWGTGRYALSMAIAQILFDWCRSKLETESVSNMRCKR